MARHKTVRRRVYLAAWAMLAISPGTARAKAVIGDADAGPQRTHAGPLAASTPAIGHQVPSESGSHVDPAPTDAAPLPDLPAVMQWLRALEARLSEGKSLDDEEVTALLNVVHRHPEAFARAAATGVLAWLPPSTSALAMLTAAGDDVDARVRAQAFAGLAASATRVPGAIRPALLDAVHSGLRDPAAEVFCAAAEAFTAADPVEAERILPSLADAKDRDRYECLRRLTTLPELPLYISPGHDDGMVIDIASVEPSAAEPSATDEPVEEVPTLVADPLFLATAAGFGLVAGGVLPGMVLPP
ncbi:MAG: hypothetical protein ACO3JL_00770, partial [Myxococcota bacterium]